MTSEFNPFLKAKLVQPADQKSPVNGVGWAAAYGQPSLYPANPPELTMFQMSHELGQEGFKSSALNFKSVAPTVNLAGNTGALSFDSAVGKQNDNAFNTQGPVPVNLAKQAEQEQELVPLGTPVKGTSHGTTTEENHHGSDEPCIDGTEGSTGGTKGEKTGGTSGIKKVVVLDNGMHGETVAGIIGNRIGRENVIKVDDPLPEAEFTDLNDFLEKGMTMAVEDKAKDIQNIVSKYSGEVGTVNISSGFSKAALVSTLTGMMSSDEEVNSSVLKDLGLDEDASTEDIVTSLVVRMENVSDGNPKLQEAQEKFQAAVDTAKENNIAIVTAAGNENDIYTQLDDAFKAKFGDDFNLIDAVPDITTNMYSKAKGVITVGAVDDHGTADISDDTAAAFSSRSDYVTVAANGVNVLVDPNSPNTAITQPTDDKNSVSDTLSEGFPGLDGTSFSAPIVSAGLATIQNEFGLDVDQRTQALVDGSVSNGNIGSRVIGNGLYDLDNAREKAQEIEGGQSA